MTPSSLFELRVHDARLAPGRGAVVLLVLQAQHVTQLVGQRVPEGGGPPLRKKTRI